MKTAKLKLALIGYGKMGKMVEQAAHQAGHSIVSRIDSKGINPYLQEIETADVCIDFSDPKCVLSNLKHLAPTGKQVVLGTTGWLDYLPEVTALVEKNQLGLIYAPNFSIGVFLFLQMIAHAAQLMDSFEQYDVGGFEIHHNQKGDAPSGTAKAMGKILLNHLQRKQRIVNELGDRPIKPEELHISSVRCGHVPGTHSVLFDSMADTITLTHEARNREGFAQGAVKAAEWIRGKKGLFTLEDMLNK